MSRRCLFLAACALLLPTAVWAEDDAGRTLPAAPDSAAMSRRIDELIATHWTVAGVQPAARSSDEEFLRRASLDLIGVIPTVAEVRAFLADERPDKRVLLIESLLSRPAHSTHLADVWRSVMLPNDADITQLGGVVAFQSWLRSQFAQNRRYDQVVADLLVATGSTGESGPALFYGAMEPKPEDLAGTTARIFLGVQIQCAQCHDHPFDPWTQTDFWSYAAFFARVERRQARNAAEQLVVDADRGEVMLPDTEDIVAPKYLGGEAPQIDIGTRRAQLAIWLASRDNPYFAKAAVNRAWSQLFGRGIVEPVDDFSTRHPASHPELLDELAAYFIETGFDLRNLLATLANTEAYQLTSQATAELDELPPELFARMAVKSLTAEQLYDSLVLVTRRGDAPAPNPFGLGANRAFDPTRLEFLSKFSSATTSAFEFQWGIPQALTLMNGTDVAAAIDPSRSSLLNAVEAPFFDDGQRVEILFLATLGRRPADEERSAFGEYVARGGAESDRRQALGDVLWALLNSGEFALNH